MLYIIGTPIGNLKDISFRAVETLGSVDYILCEDTRTSKTLLSHYGIETKTVAYHKFNEKEMQDKIVKDLSCGKNIALISDAGMPIISDPGNILVRTLQAHNLEYTVIGGVSAFLSAVILSGYNAPFTFIGFLPEKKKDRVQLLSDFKNVKSVLIFYISSHDINTDIGDIYAVFGNREAVVVREISKMYESVTHINLKDGYHGVEKGEFVLVVQGVTNTKQEWEDWTIPEHLKHYMDSGFSKNNAIKMVASDRNIKKNEVYKYAIDL